MNTPAETTMHIMKTLSNPHRLSILLLLSQTTDDLCVSQIADYVKISQSLASHQLAYLEARSLVVSERKGQTICYTLKESPTVEKVITIITILNT